MRLVEFGDYLMNRDLTMEINGLVNDKIDKIHYLMILTHGFMGIHGMFMEII